MLHDLVTDLKILNSVIHNHPEEKGTSFVYHGRPEKLKLVQSELKQRGYSPKEMDVDPKRSTVIVPLRYPEEKDRAVCCEVAQKMEVRSHIKSASGSRAKKWERNMFCDTSGKIDIMWNHKVTHFDSAIEKAERDGKFDRSKGAHATDIRIFQLDTGKSDHPRLAGYERYNTSLSRNFFRVGGLDAGDDYRGFPQGPGHSTSTAFTVIGTKGVCEPFDPNRRKKKKFAQDLNQGLFPHVDFVPVRVARSVFLFGKNVENMFKAVQYAIENNADIIAMSMAGEGSSEYFKKADDLAYRNGVIFVCAAGSQVDFFTDVMAPAENKHTIAVSGISTQRRKDSFEIIPLPRGNDGAHTTISAPAKWVYTAGRDRKGSYHRLGTGTSQSTAHVAAAAALWKHYWRDELKELSGTPSEIVDGFRLALETSMYVPDYWRDVDKCENKGVLDVEGLLQHNPLQLISNQ